MEITSFYPVLMVDDVAAAAQFYREELGFETTFEADWYVSLRVEGGELALLDRGHETIPDGFREPVQGLLLNVRSSTRRQRTVGSWVSTGWSSASRFGTRPSGSVTSSSRRRGVC